MTHTGGDAAVTVTEGKTPKQENADFWLGVRQALLQQIDYIERYKLRGIISLRTAELRRKVKAEKRE